MFYAIVINTPNLNVSQLSENLTKPKELLDKAFASLDEKSKKYVQSRVFNFVPLKQTANKLSDKLSVGEFY